MIELGRLVEMLIERPLQFLCALPHRLLGPAPTFGIFTPALDTALREADHYFGVCGAVCVCVYV